MQFPHLSVIICLIVSIANQSGDQHAADQHLNLTGLQRLQFTMQVLFLS
jgi:hypothetical protein